MFNHLGIKGNELILFAIIYGFSQHNENQFRGSLDYISKGLKISKRSVVSLISKLIEKGYIVKTIDPTGNLYSYNSELIDNIISGCEESSPLVKKVHPSGEESSLFSSEESSHNKDINNNSNKDDKLNFDNILKFLNQKTGKAMRVISPEVKRKFRARIKEGYTKKDIRAAIINATQAQHHIDNGYQYLTIEFFSRGSTLDKYAFTSSTKKAQKQQSAKVSTDEIPVG